MSFIILQWLFLLMEIIFATREVNSQFACLVLLEAEAGTGGKENYRSRASGGVSVTLLENEAIVHSIRPTTGPCTIKLESVTYSNDGHEDTIHITANETLLGSFITYSSSGNGDYWNIFRTETDFLNKIPILDALYLIKIEAIKTDTYGVEIDMIELMLDCNSEIKTCSSIVTDESSKSDNIEADEGNDQLSKGEKIGIGFSVAAIILTIIGVIIAVPSCINGSKQCCDI